MLQLQLEAAARFFPDEHYFAFRGVELQRRRPSGPEAGNRRRFGRQNSGSACDLLCCACVSPSGIAGRHFIFCAAGRPRLCGLRPARLRRRRRRRRRHNGGACGFGPASRGNLAPAAAAAAAARGAEDRSKLQRLKNARPARALLLAKVMRPADQSRSRREGQRTRELVAMLFYRSRRGRRRITASKKVPTATAQRAANSVVVVVVVVRQRLRQRRATELPTGGQIADGGAATFGRPLIRPAKRLRGRIVAFVAAAAAAAAALATIWPIHRDARELRAARRKPGGGRAPRSRSRSRWRGSRAA